MKWNDTPVGNSDAKNAIDEGPMRPEAPSFSFGAHCELVVTGCRNAALSVPALVEGGSLQTKDLLASGEVSANGKFTLEQHLNHLQKQGMIEPNRPLLVLGARNNLVNFRCPVILSGQVHAVEGEDPTLSLRPYYGLGYSNQHLVCDTALGGGSDPKQWDFFCAGIPVLWDDLDDESLFDLMLCETADHSHLFHLPRGNHPAATDVTRNAWQSLQDVFVRNLFETRTATASAMREILNGFDPPLPRCSDYFHAVTGVSDDGALVCLFAQGRLEDLGKIMRQRGCRRAVCLENSGSIMPTFLPKGTEGDAIPLVRAPNFRPRGRAAIAIELENAGFTSQPVIQTSGECS